MIQAVRRMRKVAAPWGSLQVWYGGGWSRLLSGAEACAETTPVGSPSTGRFGPGVGHSGQRACRAKRRCR